VPSRWDSSSSLLLLTTKILVYCICLTDSLGSSLAPREAQNTTTTKTCIPNSEFDQIAIDSFNVRFLLFCPIYSKEKSTSSRFCYCNQQGLFKWTTDFFLLNNCLFVPCCEVSESNFLLMRNRSKGAQLSRICASRVCRSAPGAQNQSEKYWRNIHYS